ncbi:protein FAM50A-like [Hydractinia symbiolongicarpus]|uniref:protein FAM50A-like n=1 Tax=Hydractinia symbiolongicarpus TaxID=13093 RepID=UPI00254F9121|nr:protein FAM50A-like [Hydractinia symbiolongicarpus]
MAQYKGASTDGFRAKTLLKKREKQKEEIEHLKQKISENMDQKNNVAQIDRKFASHYDAVEQELKSNTIGLVTLNEMKAKQESVLQEHEKRIALELKAKEREKERKRKNKEKEKTKKRSKLSFGFEDEEEEEEEEQGVVEDTSKRRLGKNPDVDTSFLPDKDREEEEAKERERLRKEWVQMQEKMKSESIDITYSYWDGSGHRKKCVMKKGDTIQSFLQQCLRDLRQEFTELRAVDVVSLMYVKEDLIIPHHYTFYDFIVTKARGKSGPLFSFDAYEDVRITQNAAIGKDESHAGKVCLRSWYEKNKHIFPASRWEPYDAEKKWEKYTINDKAS